MFNSLYRVFHYGLLLILFINPVMATFDPASEIKITSADGAAFDRFGRSIAIDGTRMAVGVSDSDINGNDYQGAVYIYDFDGTTWVETAKLTAVDGATDDHFGYSVSLDGDRVAVGAFGVDVGGNNSQGSVYIFDLIGNIWNETIKITASGGAANDRFGWSVSLLENRLAVGAHWADISGNSNQGASYVFDLSNGTWVQATKLTASDGTTNDRFGISVSLFDDRLAVGASGAEIGGKSGQGASYVFDLSNGSWIQTTKLIASDGATDDNFGVSVSLSAGRLAVGASGADINGNNNQGAAYIFDLNGSSWNETTKLTAIGGITYDRFGLSISLSGDRLAVGSSYANILHGAAYVFDLSGSIWSETAKLVASDGAVYDYFGCSIALSGNRLAVGAVNEDIGANINQGAVYIYTEASPAPAVLVPSTAPYGILLMLFSMIGLAWFGMKHR